ncbi:DUF986 family protein [Acerihabitans arboris]|uniref:UPF0266 membrane protein GRH90_07000 n=1 Tax=Acerihabitans arboris TaxID=2691583 RepID=A0A845SIP5_9GAMM|nr:DUF986 family protein [Acerihabitans arboris]NDL62501.1 DUF986 family protein [Acerihabitans arboris]
MSVTDIGLLVIITLSLAFAIYDEFIVDGALKGKTRLKIGLKRQSRIDGLIFIGLVLILVYQNITNNGTVFTTTLLLILAFMALYLAYIRRPKFIFKADGFFYANVFIKYDRIKNMNLSEDGYLVIDLEKRRLLIQVQHLDDLQRIYNQFLENN